jgi:regulator of cell morphogenesis and NO signaling
MSHNIDEVTPVGQIARKYPSTIAVFEELDIDYACKGGRILADAARAAGFETGTVLEALEAVIPSAPAIEPRVSELLHRIVTEHHRFEAARFRDLAARIESLAFANVFGARVRTILTELSSTVSAHMLREEKSLFPRIEELDLHPHKVRAGSISRPLLNEFVEHDVVHERIAKIRELVLRLRNVEGSDVQLLDELDEFYRAVHRHIHLENNVLIPLVLDLENRLKASRQADLAV